MLGLGLPINIERQKNCDRCGLKYLKKLPECPHCTGLSERELNTLKDQHQEKLEAASQLGFKFLGIFVLLIIVLIAIAY